jgi:Nuclease-related domain
MPGGRGNIDHLAAAPSGIYVIDAKDWSGKVSVATPLIGRQKLLIAGRDRTALIDGLDRQVAAVRDVVGTSDVVIQGVLCFTKADLPLIGAMRMRGHLLLYRKALAKRLNAAGTVDPETIAAVARQLAAAFPPA